MRKKKLTPEQQLIIAAIDTVRDKYIELNSTLNMEFLYELSKLRTDIVAKKSK